MTFSSKAPDIPGWLFNEAHLLRVKHEYFAGAHMRGLDPDTSYWVIRTEAERELRRSIDFMPSYDLKLKMFLGLPVRVTIDDLPDTPLIQIAMEPLRQAGRG